MKQTQIFFYLFFLLISVATYFLVKPYLVTILLAFFSALLFYPIYEFLYKKTKKRANLSVTLTLLVVMMLILVPTSIMVSITVNQINEFKDRIVEFVDTPSVNLPEVLDDANNLLNQIPGSDYEITVDDVVHFAQQSLKNLSSWLVDSAVGLGGSTIELATQVIVYFSLLFTFLINRDKINSFMMRLSPMDDNVDKLYLKRVSAMSKSMILGTFVIAVIQAGITAIVLYVLGVEYSTFWFVLMIFTGIIPMVGTQMVSVPIGLFQIAIGNVWQGVTIILFATIIVGSLDNILRPMLVSKDAELHPMLTLIGLLGGMKLFGPLGFLFGPVLMIIFYTTLETYLTNYRSKK